MVNPPDHASYAYVFSQLRETMAPNTLQPETSETPQPTFRTAGAPALSDRRISGLLVGRRQLPLIMQPFDLFHDAF